MTEVTHEGETLIKNSAKEIITARYSSDVRIAFDKLRQNGGSDVSVVNLLMTDLHTSIENPLPWEGYRIPSEILENNQKVRGVLQTDILQHPPSSDMEELEKFFISEHESIKQAQNRWLIANAGVMLERFTIDPDSGDTFHNWLEETFQIKPGDEVLQRHVISGDGRKKLKEKGIAVPYEHWDKAYAIDGLEKAAQLIESNPKNKGIIGKSWIYNPDNYQNAPDGKPFVSFGFLSDSRFFGSRIDLGIATPDNEFSSQYNFATKNPRRKNFVEQGVFQPKVFGTFYPRAELVHAVTTLR